MDDIMRQNPDLMEQFTRAAAQSMGNQNPGFGNFMSGMMGEGEKERPNSNGDIPHFNMPPKTPRYQTPQGRPDMRFSEDDGVNIHQVGTPAGSHEIEKTPRPRPEMKGPSNIDEILAGLKTKQQESENIKTFVAPTMPQKENHNAKRKEKSI